jgi:peptidoglycan hydrolase-like protein with peptidoglycan-binding domain
VPRPHLFMVALLTALLVGCSGQQPPPADSENPSAQVASAVAHDPPIPTPPVSTIPATPKPFAPLLYDDFSQITSGWTPLRVDRQGTVNGYSAESFAFSTAGTDHLLYNLLPTLSFAPTRYAVDLQPLEGEGVLGLLLDVRGDPADDASLAYDGVGLTISGDAVVFIKAAAGDLQVLQIAKNVTSPLVKGTSIRLAVNRDSDGLTLFVGGTEVLHTAVPAHAGGTVGFFVRSGERMVARFDNLLLTSAAPDNQPACAGIRPLFDSSAGGDAMRGADVVIAQRRLAHLGYVPGPEGTYSAQTATAVLQFQSRNGLPVDGVIGSQTWCALLSSDAQLASKDVSEAVANRERHRPVDVSLEAGLPAPLLISVRGSDGLWQIALALPGRVSLHYIDTGGDALDPTWLPGQGLLAFTSLRTGTGSAAIWILNAGSGEVKQISPSELDGQFPAWSPDGSKLMFTAMSRTERDRDKTAQNYVYTLATGQVRLWSAEHAGWSDWSRFGTIVFTHLTEHSFDIFVANADGSSAVNLTNTDDDHEDIPAWSPNGDMIAFVCNPKSDPNNRQVYVMQADGSEVRQITTLPGPNSNPIWIDATTIAFIHQPSEEVRHVYLVRLSGEVRQLSTNEGRVWFMNRFDVP